MAFLCPVSFSGLGHSSSIAVLRNHNSNAPKVAVSCKATESFSFERRNLLIGLGSLGILSNVQLSLATPISPPYLAKCGLPDLPLGAKPTSDAPPVAKAFKSTQFPVVLDSSVRIIVKRRNEKKKEDEKEVLVIEGIEVERNLIVKFDVYINVEEDVAGGPCMSEFAGGFVRLASNKKQNTSLNVGITELLEDLGAEDDEYITVTLVPRMGHVIIGGIKIEFWRD